MDLAHPVRTDLEGDAGDTAPSGSTDRVGVEFATFYTPTPWLTSDADFAWSHARSTLFDPAGQRVPESLEAPSMAVSRSTTWTTGRRTVGRPACALFRAAQPDPGRAVHSKATTLVYADGLSIRAKLDDWAQHLHLLDTKASDIDYFYTSRLPGEPADGVNDIDTHPAEPREVASRSPGSSRRGVADQGALNLDAAVIGGGKAPGFLFVPLVARRGAGRGHGSL